MNFISRRTLKTRILLSNNPFGHPITVKGIAKALLITGMLVLYYFIIFAIWVAIIGLL